ncbi:MAG: DegT/DnrJ/EryC1/StrS family aminotransferase [Nitrospinae bacterium]|nr:DegT/DnrJ/EryC1/StrS family aminotransferase [Nitrospinota bacterium]
MGEKPAEKFRAVRLSRSIVGKAEADAVSAVILQDGYLGMGKEVQSFERELAEYLGVSPDAVCCVNTGTSAVHLAVQALTRPGDEILVQSLTFVATYQAISATGAVPVSCEVLPESVTIDLADAEKKITKKTKAVLPVHYAGHAGNLAEIYTFAKRHNLRVIEDAAHAFGGDYDGKKIGSFGDTACFSFDGIKNITSGEGGAVVSSDPAVISAAKDARLLGVEKDTENRFKGARSWEFDVTRQGYRYHMSNIFAAIGRTQLRRLDNEFAPVRKRQVADYRESLAGVAGIKFFETDLKNVVPHIIPVRVLNGRRDALREFLKNAGVETGIHYKPNHLLSLYGGGATSLPVTEMLYGELLTLPMHPGLNDDDVAFVSEAVKRFFDV